MRVSLGDKSSELARAWRVLGVEQRVAAVGAILIVVSTFGPFTWVELGEILTAGGVLLLLKRRADGYEFHLPFGDGTAIAAAGAWCGLLVLIRVFDRPLGQNLLALACAAVVFGAGMRERAKRPMDDIPEETIKIPRDVMETEPAPGPARRAEEAPGEDVTRRIPPDRGPGRGDPLRSRPPKSP
jgi:hypothetical protein